MLLGSKLLEWYTAKKNAEEAKNRLQQLQREEKECAEKLDRLEHKRAALPAGQDPDSQIARMLAEQEVWQAQKDWQQASNRLASEGEELQQKITQFQFQALQLEKELEPEVLAAYQKVAEHKQNPVVEVRQKSCMGCFLPLSLSNLAEWQRGKGLVYCHECGRILV